MNHLDIDDGAYAALTGAGGVSLDFSLALFPLFHNLGFCRGRGDGIYKRETDNG